MWLDCIVRTTKDIAVIQILKNHGRVWSLYSMSALLTHDNIYELDTWKKAFNWTGTPLWLMIYVLFYQPVCDTKHLCSHTRLNALCVPKGLKCLSSTGRLRQNHCWLTPEYLPWELNLKFFILTWKNMLTPKRILLLLIFRSKEIVAADIQALLNDLCAVVVCSVCCWPSIIYTSWYNAITYNWLITSNWQIALFLRMCTHPACKIYIHTHILRVQK